MKTVSQQQSRRLALLPQFLLRLSLALAAGLAAAAVASAAPAAVLDARLAANVTANVTASMGGLHSAGAAPSPAPVSVERARGLYMLHCAGCHRPDGGGAPAFGVPTMINTLGHFQRTVAGRAFLLQVPGARNASVTDAELAALTNWAVKQFSAPTLPADFVPYTAAEAAHWRSNAPLDIAGVRAAVVEGLPVAPLYISNQNNQK